MKPARLLRIAAAYHGALGLVLLLLPRDLFTFLGLEEPTHWLLYYMVAATPVVASLACELARRREDLRPGLVFGLVLGNVASMVVVIFFVVWSGLPWALLCTGAAAGLWAWLLWGVYSPDVPVQEETATSEEDVEG